MPLAADTSVKRIPTAMRLRIVPRVIP